MYFNLVQIQYIILVETSNSNIAAVHRSRALMVAQRCLISRQIGTLCGSRVCAESRCWSSLGYADQSILETMDNRSWNIEDRIVKFKFPYDVADQLKKEMEQTVKWLLRCTLDENMEKKHSVPGIRSERHGQNANVWNATDLCVWGLGLGFWGWGEHFLYWGFGRWHFVIGVLSRDRFEQV